ncbi:MAG TPA: hypothetical protein VMV77_15925 [Bacteroidales bacterium]|nr:hypothetical protein [Bacteroidales bacterium]
MDRIETIEEFYKRKFDWIPDNIKSGSFCVFNQHFFHQYGSLNQYSVFQPNGTHIFELSDEQVEKIAKHSCESLKQGNKRDNTKNNHSDNCRSHFTGIKNPA